jgi:sulfite exporter TauE/SafE
LPIAGSTLAALFVAGLLGSVGHCLGMCGPLVAMTGIRFTERRADVKGVGASAAEAGREVAAPTKRRLPVAATLVYHAGRIAVYVVMGAIVGAAASLFGLTGDMTTFGAVVGMVIGVAVLVLGLGYAGLLPAVARASGARWWNRATMRALRLPGHAGAALLGAINGILPCGLVYAALLVGAGTGSPWGSALAMLVFGLATFPALAIVQSSIGFLGSPRRRWLMRAAGVVVFLIGLQLCLRGLAALGVVRSVNIGRFMLW